jgi:hypothetical protein
MTVRRPSVNVSKRRVTAEPQRLSLRWFVITAAAGGAYLLGAAASGPAGGVFLACVVGGLLHSILE